MKFKQKLEQMRQKFSEGLQCLALKPRVLITNLIALLQGSTKSETTGRKLTKDCNHCGVELEKGVNWAVSSSKKGDYICKKCNSKKTIRNINRRKQKVRKNEMDKTK